MKYLARVIFFTLLFATAASTSTVNAQPEPPGGPPDPGNGGQEAPVSCVPDCPNNGMNAPPQPGGPPDPGNGGEEAPVSCVPDCPNNGMSAPPPPPPPLSVVSPPIDPVTGWSVPLPPPAPPPIDPVTGAAPVPPPPVDLTGSFCVSTGLILPDGKTECVPPPSASTAGSMPPCAPPNPNLPPPPGPPPPCSAPPPIDPVTGEPYPPGNPCIPPPGKSFCTPEELCPPTLPGCSLFIPEQPPEMETVVDQDQIDRETELISLCLEVGGNWLENTCTDVQENNTQALLACMDSGGIFLGGRNGLPWNHCETQYIDDPDLPLVEDCYNSGGLWSEGVCDTSTMTSEYAEVWACVSGEYCDESFVEPECFALSELPGERATLCALSGIDPATGELLPHHPLYESENLDNPPVDEIEQADEEFLEPIPSETTLPPAPIYIPPVTIPPEPPRLPKPIMSSPVLKVPIQEMQLFNNGIVNIPKEDFDKVDWDSLSKRRNYSPKQTKYSTPKSEMPNQNSATPAPEKPNKGIVNIPKEDFDKVDWDSLSKRRNYSPKQKS